MPAPLPRAPVAVDRMLTLTLLALTCRFAQVALPIRDTARSATPGARPSGGRLPGDQARRHQGGRERLTRDGPDDEAHGLAAQCGEVLANRGEGRLGKRRLGDVV